MDGVSIRIDNQSRYCLNDLHRASGRQPLTPERWLQLRYVRELIEEISEHGGPINIIHEGPDKGIYAIENVFYNYGIWLFED